MSFYPFGDNISLQDKYDIEFVVNAIGKNYEAEEAERKEEEERFRNGG